MWYSYMDALTALSLGKQVYGGGGGGRQLSPIFLICTAVPISAVRLRSVLRIVPLSNSAQLAI